MSNKKNHVSNTFGGRNGPRRQDLLKDLYERLEPKLRRRAQFRLHDSEDARDVVQETFTAFMRAQPSLRGEASHATVIHAIFSKQVMNRLRQRSRGIVYTGSPGLDDETDTSNQREADMAHDGGRGGVEARNELAVLTRGETPRALRVAYLYLLEERTFEEIGRVLGLGRKVASEMLQQFIEHARRRESGDRSGTHRSGRREPRERPRAAWKG
jgi:RNA polymerase sigma factor (sigma-70 family)